MANKKEKSSNILQIKRLDANKKELESWQAYAYWLGNINGVGRAIRDGKVGAVLLAGGMGTRLGSDAPKGVYNIGITKDVYIFERLVQNLMQVVDETGAYIHLFVMTSEKNNDITVEFFKEHNYFGYSVNYIHFFMQEMAPATDYNGKVLMEAPNRIAASPNGNGGWYSSIINSGLHKVIKAEGIEWLNVFAVDNVLQKIADPCFVGATICNDGRRRVFCRILSCYNKKRSNKKR